jgi:hypothetical protein
MNEIYRGYVYLTLCEISFELFRKTNFTTYSGYCSEMNQALKDNNLCKRDKTHIVAMVDGLEKIFSMGDELTSQYIIDYFDSGRCCDFERAVRNTKEFFPMTGA